MGRRKRKVVKIIKRSLPRIFLCPKCGKQSVSVKVEGKGQTAHIICGGCGAEAEVPRASHEQPIDLYCKFTDKFYAGEL